MSIDTINTIAKIADDALINSLAKSYGIEMMNVAWEDCARTKGSCFGSNISDMTLIIKDIPLGQLLGQLLDQF